MFKWGLKKKNRSSVSLIKAKERSHMCLYLRIFEKDGKSNSRLKLKLGY